MWKRECLEVQQRFLIERLRDWRSPKEIIELSDLLAALAQKIAGKCLSLKSGR
jgi:hypothetical protein